MLLSHTQNTKLLTASLKSCWNETNHISRVNYKEVIIKIKLITCECAADFIYPVFHSCMKHKQQHKWFPWSITQGRTDSRARGDTFRVVRRKNKLYLCHIDEGNGAVVLPHASSSSQPEVKVHATAASEDLCTSESSVCLFEVFRTTL